MAESAGTIDRHARSRVGDAAAPILAFDGVAKRYGALEALAGVTFQVNRGEVVCLIGPSGSGKSTLLRCANALETLDGGRVVFEGSEVHASDPRSARSVRQRMGMVFQNFELFPHLTVLRNVTIGPTTVLNLGPAAAERRARELLAKVGLSDKPMVHPAALSGGQQQRVAIARALINEPSILLADEPTGNLDTRTSIEVMDIFQRLNRERGITVVLITHEMDIAEYGTRIVAFRDGLVVADKPVAKRRLAHDELAALPPPVVEAAV